MSNAEEEYYQRLLELKRDNLSQIVQIHNYLSSSDYSLDYLKKLFFDEEENLAVCEFCENESEFGRRDHFEELAGCQCKSESIEVSNIIKQPLMRKKPKKKVPTKVKPFSMTIR